MNKKANLFFLLLFCLTYFTSCIKEEAEDKEADIISFTIDNKEFLTSIINERTRKITLVLNDTTTFEKGIITPHIETSRNAIVLPASGESISLDNYKALYQVFSQDGNQKNYMVSVAPYIPLTHYFDEFITINQNSTKPYQIPADPMWSNANEGVNMLYKPEHLPFPTSYSTSSEDIYPNAGHNQGVVILKTKMGSRNDLNKPMILDLMDIPVYAGNMFRGEFDFSQAMKDPLKTMKFGQPFPTYSGKPISMNVRYKYKSGDTYVTYEYSTTGRRQKVVEIIENRQRLDTPDMYAVLFKVTKGESGRKEFLDGHNINNFLDNDLIVAYASLVDPLSPQKDYETDWTEVNLPFKYKEEVDFDINDYKLAVVLSSSAEGALYKGALDSELVVDYLQVVCESDEIANLP